MKITQEVREFAAKQNTDSFLAADPPRDGGEERSLSGGQASTGVDHSAQPHGGGGSETLTTAQADLSAEALAEKGMAEMSEKFREKGGEIYLPARELLGSPVMVR